MENGNFKEAEEVFERVFGDPDSYTVIIYIRILELVMWNKKNWKNIGSEKKCFLF